MTIYRFHHCEGKHIRNNFVKDSERPLLKEPFDYK